MRLLKSRVGIPALARMPGPIDLAAEARKARWRLYPLSVMYSTYALAVIGLAFARSRSTIPVLGFAAAGVFAWTLVEYLAHRFVLHGPFADGPGWLQRRLHRAFDHLHVEHHARPWDGNHVSGTLMDTGASVAIVGALSFVGPLGTLPVFWAALVQSYVVEEWIHHSVHYASVYRLTGPYWRSIVRHHAFHHGARGTNVAFGLSSSAWDFVLGTRAGDAARPPSTAQREGALT
jgi:sterol desaturase/sphingolipid hydroxylase (fatty acid hydroxylase superfamily)